MKYVIAKEELEGLVNNCFKNSNIPPQYDYVDELIHDKQPVEEVARGEVSCNYTLDDVFRLNGKPVSYYFEDLASRFNGKKVKIYVEVQEELPKFKDIIGLFKEKEK